LSSVPESRFLDTGGGCILRPGNVAALRENGVLFWLQASVPVIAKRIQDDTQRPSLTGEKSFVDEIAEVLAERNPRYRDAADHMIDTDSLSVREVAEWIVRLHADHERRG